MRFVTIDPRCCCGSTREHTHRVRGTCRHSCFAFTVTTWTLNLSIDGPMMWMRECVLDCDELWNMPGYEGLPYLMPEYPIVTPDNPNIIVLTVRDGAKVWRIKVDTWAKQLLSIVQTSDRYSNTHLPLQLLC